MKRFYFLFVAVLFFLPAGVSAENKAGQLKVMTYNIHNGIGLDDVMDYGRIAGVINRVGPDICAIQEADSVTGRSGGRDLMLELAGLTNMHHTFAKGIDFMGGSYGIGLLSKEKPIRVKRVPLPGREEARVALVAEFEDYVFIGTHLTLSRDDKMRSVVMLDSLAAEYKSLKPVILAGDLNMRPDTEYFKELGKTFTPLSPLMNPNSTAERPRGMIDFILGYTGGQFFTTSLSSEVVDAPIESDHRPVVSDVRFGSILRTNPYLQNAIDGGITVSWVTNTPAYSWVEYGTDTTNLTMARTLLDGQAMAGNTVNKIRIEGLQKGQQYIYRIHSRELLFYGGYQKIFGGEAVSPFYSFELPAEDQKDFTAVIFNDLHQNRETTDALNKVIKDKAVNYDFVVFNGDCIDDPGSQAQALASLSYYMEMIGAESTPIFFLRGNHEIRNSYSIGLRELLDYVGGKTYGAFNWGDTRFVMLDCGEDKPDDHWVYYGMNDFEGLRKDQVGFLKTELTGKAFKQAGKRVLIHHIPIYGSGEDMDHYNPCLALWHPQLQKAKFNVALNGHTHRYAYHPAGSRNQGGAINNFPVVIGGGNKVDRSTVMVLDRKGDSMTLTVWNHEGKELLKLDL